jgi:hypothetical protein
MGCKAKNSFHAQSDLSGPFLLLRFFVFNLWYDIHGSMLNIFTYTCRLEEAGHAGFAGQRRIASEISMGTPCACCLNLGMQR